MQNTSFLNYSGCVMKTQCDLVVTMYVDHFHYSFLQLLFLLFNSNIIFCAACITLCFYFAIIFCCAYLLLLAYA